MKQVLLMLSLLGLLASCGNDEQRNRPAQQANNQCVPNQFGIVDPACQTNGFFNGINNFGNGIITVGQLQGQISSVFASLPQGWGWKTEYTYNGNVNDILGGIITLTTGGWQVAVPAQQSVQTVSGLNSEVAASAASFTPYAGGTIGAVESFVQSNGNSAIVTHTATEQPSGHFHRRQIVIQFNPNHIGGQPAQIIEMVYENANGQWAQVSGRQIVRQ